MSVDRFNKYIENYIKKPQKIIRVLTNSLRSVSEKKFFCVGRNKTGTTSIAKAFNELGLIVGNQRMAELLIHDWVKRDFRRLFLYCMTAQAFQDVPFSLPYTFQALDQRFKNSKFILTIRDNPDQWYESLTRFHAKLWGHGHTPTSNDLRKAHYIYQGRPYETNRMVYDTPDNDPYIKEVLLAHYNAHNDAVIEYFRYRPSDLLVLNVSEDGAYDKLCGFLGEPRMGKDFPHENKTVNVIER